MPRLNIADKYGSPRYTSIGQTQPHGATAATSKMTRWIDDTNRRRWGDLPRGMTQYDYGPGGRPWGAPANSWDFEQERKDIQDRHGSDQAISGWLARTEDMPRNASPTGWTEAQDSQDGWNDDGWDAPTSLKKDGWNDPSEASSRFGYHPLSHPSDYEDESNGWGGNPKRSRAIAKGNRTGWGDESGCGEDAGWDKESGWVKESGRDNEVWDEAPVPHNGRKWDEAPVTHEEWKKSGWDASTGIGEQWRGTQDLSRSADVDVSEHFDHEDQSDGWGYSPKRSRTEAQKGRSGWGDQSGCGEDCGWCNKSGWTNDGRGTSMKSQKNGCGSGWAKDDWGNDIACHTGMKWPDYSPSFGDVLTPSESTQPSFMGLKTRQSILTQQQDEEVKELRRQLAEEKRKNAELGRRLYTLENEQIDPGSVFGPTRKQNTAEPATFEWSAEEPAPPSTTLMPDIKPKPSRKVATSFAETEHFDPPPNRLPKITLDSIASSVSSTKFATGKGRDLKSLKWEANTTHFGRLSGIIHDNLYRTRPVFFTMSKKATFGEILQSWMKRRGIEDDSLDLYHEGDLVDLQKTASMEGITDDHIELEVNTLDKMGDNESTESERWKAAGW